MKERKYVSVQANRAIARWSVLFALLLGMLLPTRAARAASITVDGSQTFQTLDGLGANIHYFAWTNQDLAPVIDALVDQAGMKVFRVVFDNTDWEAQNVYTNGVIDWDYFTNVYSSARFQHLWGLVGYLNQKGISNGVMLNFQGVGPAWMGQPLTPGYEDVWAQMLTSLLVYARNTEGLKFNLLGPDNEMNADPSVQGVATSGPLQYVTMLHDLVQELNANGLGDVKLVGPDLANSSTNWMPNLLLDPLVMSDLAHFSVHDYAVDDTDSYGVTNWLDNTAYADRSLWVTEYNVWCPTCQSGGGNYNGWDYSLGTAEYLLGHLANGATTALVWEGYDDFEATQGPGWSYWGLFGVDNINATPKTYTARKDFYTVAQLSKYLQPGAQRLGLSGGTGQLVVQAYYNSNSAQLSIVGVNSNSTTVNLNCTLASLPEFDSLNLYYTDPNTNLALAATIVVTNGSFSATIPANCVFAINGMQVPPDPPTLQSTVVSNGLMLSWPATATNFTLMSTTNPLIISSWTAVTNVPQAVDGEFEVLVPSSPLPLYFRLQWP
jgi:O-glycosyl hydrolase